MLKEHTVPTAQLDELHELFAIIRKNPLPKTREEFESRANAVPYPDGSGRIPLYSKEGLWMGWMIKAKIILG